MGGKNKDLPTPPAVEAPPDNSELMMGLFQMMMASQEMKAPELPQIPDAPTVEADPVIDWAEKNKQLLAKTKADYNVSNAAKRGRASTLLTSPLLDEELAPSDSIIAGG